MHPDLERVIHLQQIEDAADQARRIIADEPIRQRELDARLTAAEKTLADDRQLLAANQAARRDIEKDLAAQQGRLSKFRGQLMEVKTNREYQAMQKEIEVAQQEIQKLEDRLLERMLEYDDFATLVKDAERGFTDEKAAIEEARQGLALTLAEAAASSTRVAAERESLMARISPPIAAIFESVMRYRKGAAVAPVHEGRCSGCQVRIRPQTVNDLRRNEIVFQCESCQRILYYPDLPPPPQP